MTDIPNPPTDPFAITAADVEKCAELKHQKVPLMRFLVHGDIMDKTDRWIAPAPRSPSPHQLESIPENWVGKPYPPIDDILINDGQRRAIGGRNITIVRDAVTSADGCQAYHNEMRLFLALIRAFGTLPKDQQTAIQEKWIADEMEKKGVPFKLINGLVEATTKGEKLLKTIEVLKEDHRILTKERDALKIEAMKALELGHACEMYRAKIRQLSDTNDRLLMDLEAKDKPKEDAPDAPT